VRRQDHPHRRWPLRLVAAIPSCLVSAILVAAQIPAVREAVGIANSVYRLTNSTIPTLGIAAIWVGFLLIVGGVIATWQSHRAIKDGTTRQLAEGSGVLATALGCLVAVIVTLGQAPVAKIAAPEYEANVPKHHRRAHHRHHAQHSSTGNGAAKAPAPAAGKAAPAPASSPQPSPSGGSSTSGGGGGNTVTLNKTTNLTSTTGNADGPGATSGPATNNNSESTNISIG
jgi:hypothetical protein